MIAPLASATTDWLSATAAWATAVIGAVATLVAWYQLKGLRFEARLARGELRMSGLMAVLEIESQMSDRKAKLDELSREIQELDSQMAAAQPSEQTAIRANIELVGKFLDSAIENYLNAVDRLCYCIIKQYLADRDWRAEYRNYLHGTVQTYQHLLGPGTAFRNIVELEAAWQRD